MGLVETLQSRFSRKRAGQDAVFSVYHDLVGLARGEDLYKKFAIPDTLDGRFEAIVLHLALFLVATRDVLEGAGKGQLGRDLNQVFLKDMDRNLREMGVGDLSVGKQVKKMASAHYGRLRSYEQALTGKDAQVRLMAALRRNLYRGEKVSGSKLAGLADYSLTLYGKFKTLSAADILAAKTKGVVS
ncbi:MAG: ubiquinol-cytochrome C chaperone family protein [Proteobacteria bacterium]|nr:ubiquinol-cytochrome C chaperone family protein [Pseudomonadota bacterium]